MQMAGKKVLGTYTPKMTLAGDFPVVTDSDTMKTGESASEFEVLCKTADGMTKVTADTIEDVYGIAAADSDEDGNVVLYLTGEFFADALIYPEGIAAGDLKASLRKLNIFMK